ncbi:MAG: PhoH family protein [Agitococcus sp.]|nr:PhoH family protein [Agitococcus sp.]
MPRKSVKKASLTPVPRLFVLDTNILLHDPYSTLKFKEHDIFIPFVTLEELDGKKVGTQDVNRNARQATRLLDAIVSQVSINMRDGFPLIEVSAGAATGKLYLQQEGLPFLAEEHVRKNDNLYLAVLSFLTKMRPTQSVVMVTKDLNLRIKARAMGFAAEDYLHDHAVEDADLVYRGIRNEPVEFLETWADSAPLRSWKEKGQVYYQGAYFSCEPNEFILFDDGSLYQVVAANRENDEVRIASVLDRKGPKAAVQGIANRNAEQQAAFSLLMDPDIDFVALLGPAGTGKTLLTLAAAVHQAMNGRLYDEIIFTRATIPLGDDIGFLPGTEEEKMRPWAGALDDNLEVLIGLAERGAGCPNTLSDTLKDLVSVKAITFMRGRTFQRKFLIIDEAQNLTPKQVKTLITRAGEGTKIVCMGNLAQIDSPYLSEASSGLAYAVERFKGWPHFGALVLSKGERSRLANAGNDRL